MKDLWWIFALIAGLWILWFLTGGPENAGVNNGPFMRGPFGAVGDGEVVENGDDSDSSFADAVRIADTSGTRENDPQKEYIELYAPSTNAEPVVLTGWSLRNRSGENAAIGKVAELPRLGFTNAEEPLIIHPGETVIVSSGYSPIGISFLVNSCSGYFEQFQDFYPPLSRSCPAPVDDALYFDHALDSECIDYLKRLPRCEIYTDSVPGGLSRTCHDYIQNNMNYNSCTDVHRNDSNFKKREWRVFLERNTQMWDDTDELIRLYDSAGELVDSVSY